MKVIINGKFLCQQKTGVQAYATGLAEALIRSGAEVTILCPCSRIRGAQLPVKRSGWSNLFLWEQLWLPIFMLFHRKKILINLCNSAPVMVKRQIITIHDLAYINNPGWFRSSFVRWYRFLIPRICKRSLSILTVSEQIKKEIAATFMISPEKITVIPNGCPEFRFHKKNLFEFKYLLLTGIRNPRKNALFVLRQIDDIVKKGYHLVCLDSAKGPFNPPPIEKHDLVHLLDYVDETTYYTLIKNADALIYPSHYEGFGIPILESLMLGTPVIAAENEVYKESFGDLPIYYKADDPIDFLNSLDKIKSYQTSTNVLLDLRNKYTFNRSAGLLADRIKNIIQD